MKFKRLESLADFELVYECFRTIEEPDSPRIPFEKLTDFQRQELLEIYKPICELFCSKDGEPLGYLFVTDHRDGKNLGGAMLSEKRGHGYGSAMFKLKAGELAAQGNAVYASTMQSNIAAIKVMERAGFTLEGKEKKPPLGRFQEPQSYLVYKYNPS